MRIAIFFACMCFLLLSGGNYASVPVHQACTHQIEKKQQIKFVNNKQQCIEIADNSVNEQQEYLIEEEDEDKSINKAIARKYSIINKSYLSPFVVSNFKISLQSPPTLNSLHSNIYISQRTLRI